MRFPARRAAAALRLSLAGVLALSGIGKLIDAEAAKNVFVLLVDHDPLSAAWAEGVVGAIACIELALAALLLSGWRPRLALAGSAALVSAFTLALLTLPARGLSVAECGCFGALLPSGSLAITSIRNLSLLALCWLALRCTRRRPEREEHRLLAQRWSQTS